MSGSWAATYRLQLRREFDFGRVAELASYLEKLGISHVYFSPIVQAAAGSTHGYDVVDPTKISEDLGGRHAYDRATAALRQAGLDQLVDVVPNHMSIASSDNPWWWDVLERGPESRYLSFFDLGWSWQGTQEFSPVVLPVLGDRYGNVLKAGAIRIEQGSEGFVIAYGSQRFPLAMQSHACLLDASAVLVNAGELLVLADAYRAPARSDGSGRDQERYAALWSLYARVAAASPNVQQAMEDLLQAINADPYRLHALLEEQHYRLAFWERAYETLSYRRFFDINTLIGVRVEDEQVFAERHGLLLDLVAQGLVDGLRVDHIDGLRDPGAYLERLRQRTPEGRLYVEKILAPHEAVPESWPIEGTTGYDFLNVVNGLFVDGAAEERLTQLYVDITGEFGRYEDVLDEGKRLVLRELFAGDFGDLVNLLARISDARIESRDWRRLDLEKALFETIMALPVYRTYVQPWRGSVGDRDRKLIDDALAVAHKRLPAVEQGIFEFLRELLTLEVRGELEDELVLRLQQLTGPVMAKGAEDTAFYRYNRLISLNEVGGEPGHFGVSLDEFHSFCAEAALLRPRSMLATATHDTKRGEDARLRISALSEMPDAWAETVDRWRGTNARHRSGDLPDANFEYLLYQTLVGAWPVDAGRAVEFLIKAAREAKKHTSWRQHDEAYESALEAFARGLLDDGAFCQEIESFVAGIDAGARTSSLAQTLLKLTAPGLPDIYQGTELWDHNLVDPDNRRPVDYDERARLLDLACTAGPIDAMTGLDSGLPKLWLIRRTLEVRTSHPAAFDGGSYAPLRASGAKAAHVVEFCRGDTVVTVVPRLARSLVAGWQGTKLSLPPGRWRNALSADASANVGGGVAVEALLRDFPVALLVKDDG